MIFEWDSMDVVYSTTNLPRNLPTISHRDKRNLASTNTNGYPDVIARVDVKSARVLSISPNYALHPLEVYLMDFFDQERKPLPFCPRSTLKNILNRYQSTFKLQVGCGFELEWYNYKGNSMDVLNSTEGVYEKAITPGMFGYSALRPFCRPEYVSAILQHCQSSGIELDCFHTETGPGVYEAALKYKDALEATDECQLFKYIVKTTAYHNGITASFMAKPWDNFPGCGGHIHISLSNSAGENVFSTDIGSDGLPRMMRPMIAGILKCLPDLMPFMAPNINSYKRLDIRYWAPVIVGWGFDNRLAAVRVIISKEDPANNRIEVRIPGADMNPYYALAAILAAGMYGLENDLTLDPPLDSAALLSGDNLVTVLREKGYHPLPTTLFEATTRMTAVDSLAWKLFPAGLIEHFGMTRMHEIKTFETHVTEWERQRYLELA